MKPLADYYLARRRLTCACLAVLSTVDARAISDDSLIRLHPSGVNCGMLPVRLLDELSPYARVVTAIAPFLLAIVLRLTFGKNRVTRILLSISTTWFAINILLAPYSANMQRDLNHLRAMFR
jgi:hypothetical protein